MNVYHFNAHIIVSVPSVCVTLQSYLLLLIKPVLLYSLRQLCVSFVMTDFSFWTKSTGWVMGPACPPQGNMSDATYRTVLQNRLKCLKIEIARQDAVIREDTAATPPVGQRWRFVQPAEDLTIQQLGDNASSACHMIGTDLESHLWNPLRARLEATQSLTAQIFQQTMLAMTSEFLTDCHRRSMVIHSWKKPQFNLDDNKRRFLQHLPIQAIPSSRPGDSQ
jgi:hypothetical protein